MATAQKTRNEEKSQSDMWTEMFPTGKVTEQQSVIFSKKLLAVAISNITYLRNIFPERAYSDRCLADLNLKILRDDRGCAGASQVIKWIKGCFDALEKKYLRMLQIGIYVDPDDPQSVIEAYMFKFSYSSQGGFEIYRNGEKISSTPGSEQIQKETTQLLRTLVVLTQSLQPLPDNVMLTMKILYYDEVTPPEYEPPGFKPSDCDNFMFEDEPVPIRVGEVTTRYHCMKMHIKTDKKQFDMRYEDAASEGQPISNSGLDTEQEGLSQQQGAEDAQEIMETAPVAPSEDAAVPVGNPAEPEGAKMEADTGDGPDDPSRDDDYTVLCPCGCNEDDGLMVVCDICNMWQHAVCFCIPDEDSAPEKHACNTCAKADDSVTPTDPYLKDLSTIAVQATCLWRRTIFAATNIKRLTPIELANRIGVDISVAKGLMRRLEKEGFVRNMPSKDRRQGKLVMKNKLMKEGIPAYLRPSNKKNNPPQGQAAAADVAGEERETVKKNVNSSETVKKNVNSKETAKKNVNRQETVKKNVNSLRKRKSPVFERPPELQAKLSDLTEKTANISLHGHQLRSSSTGRKKTAMPSQKENEHADSTTNENEKESDQKRGQKRAFSKVDKNVEFEVSSSQETATTRPTQRKKCSDVHKSVRV